MAQASNQIRVNPASIRNYAAEATDHFSSISTELEGLMDKVINVNYHGPNAQQFKRQCGQMTADYSNRLLKDMRRIADAVRQSTSNIVRSLGGQPVTITIEGRPLRVPDSIPTGADDSVQVELQALETLGVDVTAHFTAINENLRAHLTALRKTDWSGQAKENAVSGVQKFTQSALGSTDEAKESLTTFIRGQIDDTRQSDA